MLHVLLLKKVLLPAAVLLLSALNRLSKILRVTILNKTLVLMIVLRAMEEPMRQIVRNAGDEPSVVVDRVANGKGNFGFNAQTGEYGDMIEMGVLDPTKVTRTALQNAASVASLILTTECMIADMPEDKPAMAPDGHGRRNGRNARHDVIIR